MAPLLNNNTTNNKNDNNNNNNNNNILISCVRLTNPTYFSRAHELLGCLKLADFG